MNNVKMMISVSQWHINKYLLFYGKQQNLMMVHMIIIGHQQPYSLFDGEDSIQFFPLDKQGDVDNIMTWINSL